MKKLKFECEFCGTPTNFKDNNHAYCIDCYVKIRNSAHTHLPVNPWPVTPQPTYKPFNKPYIGDIPEGIRIVC